MALTEHTASCSRSAGRYTVRARQSGRDWQSELWRAFRVCCLICLLSALGGSPVVAEDSEPGVRHVLKSSRDESAFCSLLAPIGWQVKHSVSDESNRDRYLFHPPDATYPYLMVDAWHPEADEVEHRTGDAQQLPEHPLLEGDASDRAYDSSRSAVWQVSRSDRMVTVRVELLHDPMLILQYAGTVPSDPAEQQTMVKVVDAIDFQTSDSDEQDSIPLPAAAGTVVQPKFLLQTETEFLSGSRRKIWLPGLIVGVVVALFAFERLIRRRQDAQRIRDVEAQIQARQAELSPHAGVKRRRRSRSGGDAVK